MHQDSKRVLLSCSPAGCSNCKRPGFKPTASNLAKRAELGGKTMPRVVRIKSPDSSSSRPKAPPRKPPKKEKEVIEGRGTASRPSAGKKITIANSDDDGSSDSEASDSDDDTDVRPGSSAQQPISSGRPASGTKSSGRKATAPPPAPAPAAPAPRYSYCSGKSPLVAARALAGMRTKVEGLGERPS